MWMWIGIIVGVIILVAVMSTINSSNNKDELIGAVAALESFTISDQTFSSNGKSGICYDEDAKRICLMYKESGRPIAEVYAFGEIVDVEIVINDSAVSKASTGSAVGRAAVGGVLLGPLGAIVGGVTGKRSETGMVGKIALVVTVQNLKRARHEVVFNTMETKADGFVANLAMEQANTWYSKISAMIAMTHNEAAGSYIKPD